ncbi:MAG: T9SS type A sorting domain-containing protein [Ferruginibacter sp.]
MRTAFLVLSLIVVVNSSQAQVTIIRQIVAVAGKDTLIGSTTWASTVGEPVIETYNGANITLTQGFNQPDGFYITPFFPYINNLLIYPNPGRPNSILRFYLKADKPRLNISIYDGNGKLYISKTLESFAGQTWHNLNPQIMAGGTYTVKVTVGFEVYTARYIVLN